MHSCPRSHVLSLQGEQSISTRTTLAWNDHGEVRRQSVGPKIATSGTPKAAPMCIGPESLVTRKEDMERSAINSRTVVFPARSIDGVRIAVPISPASGASAVDPNMTTTAPHAAERASATAANRSGYHRFAEP